jgi:hypothetical protein
MNTATTPVPPPVPAPANAEPAGAQEARIAHLFRTARRAGRIHPLQHLLQRYRRNGVAPTEGAP